MVAPARGSRDSCGNCGAAPAVSYFGGRYLCADCANGCERCGDRLVPEDMTWERIGYVSRWLCNPCAETGRYRGLIDSTDVAAVRRFLTNPRR